MATPTQFEVRVMSAVELIDQNKDILDELATRGLVARTPFGLVLTERGREALEAA